MECKFQRMLHSFTYLTSLICPSSRPSVVVERLEAHSSATEDGSLDHRQDEFVMVFDGKIASGRVGQSFDKGPHSVLNEQLGMKKTIVNRILFTFDGDGIRQQGVPSVRTREK